MKDKEKLAYKNLCSQLMFLLLEKNAETLQESKNFEKEKDLLEARLELLKNQHSIIEAEIKIVMEQIEITKSRLEQALKNFESITSKTKELELDIEDKKNGIIP